MTRSTDPSKNVFFLKSPPPQFQDKAVQSNILWLILKKSVSILQSAHKQGNLSFHFHAPGSKRIQTASAVQNTSPVCSSFVLVIASDMHPESEIEKRAKNVDFQTTKNIQIQPTLFRYF